MSRGEVNTKMHALREHMIIETGHISGTELFSCQHNEDLKICYSDTLSIRYQTALVKTGLRRKSLMVIRWHAGEN